MMEKTYIADGVLISVLSEKSCRNTCNIKFLAGRVTNDETNQITTGSYLITLEVEWYGDFIFFTKDGRIFETSNLPTVLEVSCAEFLLMRTNSFEAEDILRIRGCSDKSQLIAAFDN